jgi:hypothetical protein
MESALASKHHEECGWHRDWHNCSCGLFDILVYVEPGENEEPVSKRITAEEAIDKQVVHAKHLGYTYSSQEEALQDFIINNWAWFERL